jgi:hypothetical protein
MAYLHRYMAKVSSTFINQVRVAFELGQNASRFLDKLLNVAHRQLKSFDVSWLGGTGHN